MPDVACQPVVAASAADVEVPTLPPAQLQAGIDSDEGEDHHSLPGPSRGCAYFRENLACSSSISGLNQDDIDFLSFHLAPGSASGYGHVWKKFTKYYTDRNIDPFTCSVATLVKYLRE